MVNLSMVLSEVAVLSGDAAISVGLGGLILGGAFVVKGWVDSERKERVAAVDAERKERVSAIHAIQLQLAKMAPSSSAESGIRKGSES